MPAPSCSHTKQPVQCRLNMTSESELVEVAMTTMSQQEEDNHQSGMYMVVKGATGWS